MPSFSIQIRELRQKPLHLDKLDILYLQTVDVLNIF